MRYSIRLGWWWAGIAIFALMRVGNASSAGALFALFSLMALAGKKWALRALCLSCLATMWNPGLGPPPSMGAAGRFLVIIAACASLLIRWPGLRGGAVEISRPVGGVLLFGGFITVHSFLLSPYAAISVLKAVSWTAAMTACVAAWNRQSQPERAASMLELKRFLTAILVLSAPFVVRSEGYFRNGSGFQGVLSHPQTFGPVMALLAGWSILEILASRHASWGALLRVGLSAWFVLASEARTAGLAVVLAVAIVVPLSAAMSGGRILYLFPGLSDRKLHFVALLGIAMGVLHAPLVTRQLGGFLEKRRETTGLLEAYESSRGDLVEAMWKGFEEHPVLGNGFGIASKGKPMDVSLDATTGLPLSATVEKGLMPMAILEELGVLGFAFALMWLWGALRRAMRAGSAEGVLAVSVLAINFGEYTFFSAGGLGMLLIVCFSCGAAHPLNATRLK